MLHGVIGSRVPLSNAPFALKAKMSEEAALRKFPAIQLFQVQSTILMGLNIVTQHSYFCAFATLEAAPLRLSFSCNHSTYSLAGGFFNFLDACTPPHPSVIVMKGIGPVYARVEQAALQCSPR